MSDSASNREGVGDLLATRLVLSRIVGKPSGRRVCWNLCRLLELLAPNPDEIVRPGELGGWPANTVPYRRCGREGAEIDRLWRAAAKGRRLLEDEILDAFVPKVLWPTVEALIGEGPEPAFVIMHDLLYELAEGDETAPAEQTLTAGAIDHIRQAFLTLSVELNALRRLEAKLPVTENDREPSAFAAWFASDYPKLPRGGRLRARPGDSDRSAPPRRFLRLLIFGIDWEIHQRRAAGNSQLFRLLRDRALLAVAILGMRPSALARMLGADVQAGFRFPDGEVGPAIFANPRKTLHWSVISPKAISEQAYGWLREYMEFAAISEDEPLWLAKLSPRTGYSGHTLSNRIVSLLDPPPERELLLNPYFRAIGASWPTRRLSSGTLRHLGAGLGFDAGLDWILEHRQDVQAAFSTLPGEPDLFSKALLDQALGTLAARYRDAASPQGRIRYGRIAALGAYEHLLGSRGARRAVDPARLTAAREQLAAARAAEAAIEAEIDRIERRIASVEIRHLSPQQRELYQLEASQALVGLLRLARELNSAGKRTAKADAELAAAKQTFVPIDDLAELPPTEALEEEEAPDNEPELPVLREFAWPEEFRWAIGPDLLPASTLRRWMAGKLPHPDGDRRNLLDLDAVESISERVRRIRLDRLDWTRYSESIQERLDAIRRMPDPRGSRSYGQRK